MFFLSAFFSDKTKTCEIIASSSKKKGRMKKTKKKEKLIACNYLIDKSHCAIKVGQGSNLIQTGKNLSNQ